MALLFHVECLPSIRSVPSTNNEERFALTQFEDWNNATVFLQFWIPDTTIPVWAWYILFFVFFSLLTTLGVNFYGETEYYFGMFKFFSLVVLFFISILADTGAFGNGYVGFKYWKEPYGECFVHRDEKTGSKV